MLTHRLPNIAALGRMARSALGSTLLRSSSVYTLTNILNAAVPFFLLPLLTRYLSPVDYGYTAIFQMLVGLLVPLMGLSLNGALSTAYYKEGLDFRVYAWNCLLVLLATTTISSLTFFLFLDAIGRLASFPAAWLWSIPVATLGQLLASWALLFWQVRVKPVSYGLFQTAQTLLNVLLVVVFIVGLDYNWEGRVLAQVLTSTCFGLVAVFFILKDRWLSPKLSWPYIRQALAFSLPLLPYTLSGFINLMVGRYVIARMVGIGETGLYAIGYQIGSIIGLLEDSFNQAWVPWCFAKLKKGDPSDKVLLVKITYVYFVVILAMTVILALTAPWFFGFFLGKSFEGSIAFVVWIALGYSFNGMYKMVANYLFYSEKTHLLSLVTFVSAILNVGLTVVLVKANGAVGAAQATTLNFLFGFLMTWYWSHRTFAMPWNLRAAERKEG